LPYNKGCHHSFWSILEKTPNGASIHWMDQNLDSGPIIDQVEFKDDGFMYPCQIQKQSNLLCIFLLKKNLENIMNGLSISKNNKGGSYHKKMRLKMAQLLLKVRF